MRTFRIFAVRDGAAEIFGTPIFLESSGEAVRSFSDAINKEDKDSMLWMHPDDYELFEIGEYDTGTAELKEKNPPERLARGKDVKMRTNGKGE